MKASYKNSRSGSPDHNDRHISDETAAHIIWSRTGMNVYEHIYQKEAPDMTFSQVEHRFYEENFRPYLDAYNARRKKEGHPERTKNVDSMLKNERTMPEETIIQIGNIYEQPDPDDPEYQKVLCEILEEMKKYSDYLTNGHCKVLSAAIHMDESTPHIHIRKVWVYRDEKDGLVKVGQEKALEHANVPLRYPDNPRRQCNTRKMTYDEYMRDKLYELCRERGLELDEIPDPSHTTYLTKKDYILTQIDKARERTRKLKIVRRERTPEDTPDKH